MTDSPRTRAQAMLSGCVAELGRASHQYDEAKLLALFERYEQQIDLLKAEQGPERTFIATHAIATDCLLRGCAHGERLTAAERERDAAREGET